MALVRVDVEDQTIETRELRDEVWQTLRAVNAVDVHTDTSQVRTHCDQSLVPILRLLLDGEYRLPLMCGESEIVEVADQRSEVKRVEEGVKEEIGGGKVVADEIVPHRVAVEFATSRREGGAGDEGEGEEGLDGVCRGRG